MRLYCSYSVTTNCRNTYRLMPSAPTPNSHILWHVTKIQVNKYKINGTVMWVLIFFTILPISSPRMSGNFEGMESKLNALISLFSMVDSLFGTDWSKWKLFLEIYETTVSILGSWNRNTSSNVDLDTTRWGQLFLHGISGSSAATMLSMRTMRQISIAFSKIATQMHEYLACHDTVLAIMGPVMVLAVNLPLKCMSTSYDMTRHWISIFVQLLTQQKSAE